MLRIWRSTTAVCAGWAARYLVIAMTLIGCSRTVEPTHPVPTNAVSSTSVAVAKSPASDRQQSLTELLVLIRQRLEVMPGVAQAKWNRKLPITDARRELALLDAMQAQGVTLGLPADFVREFFQAQITAAKLVQDHQFADWAAHDQPPFSQAPNLETEVRPRIDELNRNLLTTLSKCWTWRSDDDWPAMLAQTRRQVFPSTSMSPDVVDAALQPLRMISTPSR